MKNDKIEDKIKFTLDKMNNDTDCNEITSGEFNFFNIDAENKILNHFVFFLNLCNENCYFMSMLVKLVDIFYEKKLTKVAKNKFKLLKDGDFNDDEKFEYFT